MVPRKESLTTAYAARYLTLEGSIDDDETLEIIIHWVQNVDFSKFEPNEPKQVSLRVGGQSYYVCASDITDTLTGTREKIKAQRDFRNHVDRRHSAADRRQSGTGGRRASDYHPEAPADL